MTIYAADSFFRNTPSARSWGTAPTGGVWQDGWASPVDGFHSVNAAVRAGFIDGAGALGVEPGVYGQVLPISQAAVDVSVNMQWTINAWSGVIASGLVLRYTSAHNFVLVELIEQPAGALQLQVSDVAHGTKRVVGATTVASAYTALDEWSIRAVARDDVLNAKAFLTGSLEPDWQVAGRTEITAAGKVGCRVANRNTDRFGPTGAGLAFWFKSFVAGPPLKLSLYVSDTCPLGLLDGDPGDASGEDA